MKKYKLIRKFKKIAALVFLGAACFAADADFLYAEPLEMRAQTYYSSNMALTLDTFAKNVNEKSGGKLHISVYYCDQLVSTPNMLKGIKNGMIPIGNIIAHMYPEIKAGRILSAAPFATSSVEEAIELFDKGGLEAFAERQFEKQGLVYLSSAWAAPYHLLSKKPVNSLDDLRKMRVRALGMTAEMLKILGVTCVDIPPESLYIALRDDIIDVVVYGAANDYIQFNLNEVAKWYNTTPLVIPVVDCLVISKDVWDTLSPDLQKLLKQEAKAVSRLWYDETTKNEEEFCKTVFKDTLCEFPAEDVEKLRQAAYAVWEAEMLKDEESKEAVMLIKKFLNK